jgi:hypothetical protein
MTTQVTVLMRGVKMGISDGWDKQQYGERQNEVPHGNKNSIPYSVSILYFVITL